MLIATFGPTTAWQGLRITWGDGAFMLEGQGAVTAADVMEYDRQGHLIWADEGTRAWVGSRAAGSKAVSAGSTPALAGDERHPRLSRAVVVAAGHDEPVTTFAPKAKGAEMNLISTAQVVDAIRLALSFS